MHISDLQKREKEKLVKILECIKRKKISEYAIEKETRMSRTTIMRIMNKTRDTSLFNTKKGKRNAKIHSITPKGILFLYSKNRIDALEAYSWIKKNLPLKDEEIEIYMESHITGLENFTNVVLEKAFSELVKEINFDAFYDKNIQENMFNRLFLKIQMSKEEEISKFNKEKLKEYFKESYHYLAEGDNYKRYLKMLRENMGACLKHVGRWWNLLYFMKFCRDEFEKNFREIRQLSGRELNQKLDKIVENYFDSKAEGIKDFIDPSFFPSLFPIGVIKAPSSHKKKQT